LDLYRSGSAIWQFGMVACSGTKYSLSRRARLSDSKARNPLVHNIPRPFAPSSEPDYCPDQCSEWAHCSRLLERAPLNRDALYSDFQPLVSRLVRQYAESAEQREDLRG